MDMKTDGILFSEMNQLVKEQEHLTAVRNRTCWQQMQYETGEFSGVLLLAGEETYPAPVTLKLGLSGWHRIFIGTINMRSDNYLYLRLTDDPAYSGIRALALYSPRQWCNTEYAEELFWKCADLSGQDIVLSKSDSPHQNACTLAWIRCVPMTEEEIAAEQAYHQTDDTRCVQFHIDEDLNYEDAMGTDEELLVKEAPLCGTDVKLLSMEISFDYDLPEEKPYTPILRRDALWAKADYRFQERMEYAIRKRIDFLHQNGIAVYAANRMNLCDFQAPYSMPNWTIRFATEHPEYYIKTRDGRTSKICSYAYPEVQDYIIDTFRRFVSYGFDGVTLIYIRGMHIGFETPVLERFAARYPDLDPHRLPMDDPRLNGIWREMMTEFMQRLTRELDESAGRHIAVNVIVGYGPEASCRIGPDVEEWAKQGLIDAVTQGHMEIYEKLDGTIGEDGLIDLDLYDRKNRREIIVSRHFLNHFDKVLDGIEKYSKICKRYGLEFYGIMPWPRTVKPAEYIELAGKMRAAGAKQFAFWNSNQPLWNLNELRVASMLGHDRIPPEHYQSSFYRVLSIDGNDISSFNPNWRG